MQLHATTLINCNQINQLLTGKICSSPATDQLPMISTGYSNAALDALLIKYLAPGGILLDLHDVVGTYLTLILSFSLTECGVGVT